MFSQKGELPEFEEHGMALQALVRGGRIMLSHANKVQMKGVARLLSQSTGSL